MSHRYTHKDCQDMLEILARAMNRPTIPYVKDDNGKLIPNTGAWYLDEYQGGYKIVEMLATTGERDPFGATRYPAGIFCSMVHRMLDIKRIIEEDARKNSPT